MSNLFITILD